MSSSAVYRQSKAFPNCTCKVVELPLSFLEKLLIFWETLLELFQTPLDCFKFSFDEKRKKLWRVEEKALMKLSEKIGGLDGIAYICRIISYT